MARVLVVDDEPRIVDVVEAYLTRDGHEVRTAADGPTALAEAVAWRPDLMVLDVMLPGRSGFDVLRELRGAGVAVPVILLTARDDLVDRVAGLELGADDYVTKPFEPRELAARVGAILRRAGGTAPQPPLQGAPPVGGIAPQPPVALDDLEIDVASREVRRGAARIRLTRAEFELLLALAEPPARGWSRDQLGGRVFGEAFDAFDRTIDSHVKNLRHKLGTRPRGGSYVETIRGVGYRAAPG
jgi:two-component system OmpR family response regulator